VNLLFQKFCVCGFLVVALLTTRQLSAQYLTLEGQTGGFLTPTAYVVYMEKGHALSHPAIGVHFISASKVIGNIETFSITEAFYGRAEAGYTRSVHQFGNSGPSTTVLANAVLGSTASATSTPVTPNFSQLWNASGMNIFHGKVVVIKDGQFGPWTPGVAVGGVVRTGDKFVSGEAGVVAVQLYDQYCQETSLCAPVAVPAAKSYTNGDVYIAVSKTWAQEAGSLPGEHRLEGHQCHHLRHWRTEHALWRTVLRRSRHSAAHRKEHRGRALGGLYAGAAHIKGPWPESPQRHSSGGRQG
jgi:hypothetical protein